MKILVTGAGGMLGRDLTALLEEAHDVVPLDHNWLDITDRVAVSKTLSSVRPEVVINCAAYSKVDSAEEEREAAFRVNGLGAQNLALACNEFGVTLCHISTDYVFDGTGSRPYTPFDRTSAVNVYGETKLAGERYIQWLMERFYIIRTSWLYGRHGNSFVKTILNRSEKEEEIKVVSDQMGSPTWTATLSEGIVRIIESGVYGIHHVTDRTSGGISWYDFAAEIVRLSGNPGRVIPVSSEEYPTPARRPSYSVLDTFYTEVSTGFHPPDWRESLERFIQTLRNHSEESSS